MPKKLNLFIFILISMFIFVGSVSAMGVDGSLSMPILAGTCLEDDGEVIAFLQDLYNIMKILAPLLCLIFSISDFVKAVASDDKEALKKASKTAFKRLCLALLIFFLPTLINFLGDLLGWGGTCGIE